MGWQLGVFTSTAKLYGKTCFSAVQLQFSPLQTLTGRAGNKNCHLFSSFRPPRWQF